MKAIVIISYTGNYGWKSIIDCYNSIRNIDRNITIIIVNNYNESLNQQLVNDTNLRYVINENNGYELGSIKIALYSNPDISNFYIVHDSCLFENKIPDFNNDTIFWKTTILDIAPVMPIINNWINTYFPDININDSSKFMCQGLMGYFSRELLCDAMEYGLKHITITSKLEAVASEGIFGIILDKLKPDITNFYNYKLDDYITGEQPYSFIIKLAGGKSSGSNYITPTIFIYNEHPAHPTYKFPFLYNNTPYDSLEHCIQSNQHHNKETITMNYLKQNKMALDYITSQILPIYTIQNDTYNISSIFESNKHKLYILQYFDI